MTRHTDDLSPRLAKAVGDAREVPHGAAEHAQRRLAAALAARASVRPRRRGLAGAFAAVAAALALAVVLVGLPLMSGQGDAFAAAQMRFRTFSTLRMDVAQRFEGEVIQTSRTWVDATGATRTDVGRQLSIVVDPARGRMLTLLHDSREALPARFPARSGSFDGELGWLDELRRFEGQAVPIAATRLIDGRPARGWTLPLAGRDFELWTDADGLPLQLRPHGDLPLQVDYRFAFDLPMPPGALDTTIPPGYRAVAPDAD